jgi:hypothetical protein
MNVEDALAAAEKPVKEVLLGLIANSENVECKIYTKRAELLKKFNPSQKSLVSIPDDVLSAKFDYYTLQVTIGPGETDMKLPQKYITESTYVGEDAALALSEFQETLNKLFMSIAISFSIIAKHNEICNLFDIKFEAATGRTHIYEKSNPTNTQYLFITT